MENKRSLKCLIVAACLALLIVSIGGIVSAAGTAVETNSDLKIAGASLDISDKISIAFAVDAAAIGYNADENTATTKVYMYSENPTGSATAAGEKEVETLKLMTVGGKNYVMFISEGFAPVAYGETVYVRLENKETKDYGKVYKTSVIELVKNLQAKLDKADARYEAKAGLYNAILTYGQTAQKVLGNDYPVYNYFTVADGGYVDEAGQTWASGVVEKGTKVDLVTNINTGMPTVWTDGTNNLADGKNVAVANGANYSYYYDMSIVNDQPWVTGWNGLAKDTYSETQIKQMLIDKGVDKISTTGASGISTRTFSVNAQGNGVYSISQPQRYYSGANKVDGSYLYYPDGTKVSSTSVSSGNHLFRLRNDYAKADQPMVMSFTLNFPATDINGNGLAYDVGPYQYTETVPGDGVDPETGEASTTTKTSYANGDMFKSDDNKTMLRLPICAVSSVTGASSSSNIFMYVGFEGTCETNEDGIKVVSGWKLRLASGARTKDGKTYLDGDANSYADTKIFDIDTPHDISLEFVPAADGTVKEIKIFVDGEYRLSHTAAKGIGTKNQGGFTSNPKIFGASTYVGFDNATLGRFVGNYEFSNVQLTMKNHVTVDQLEANGYSQTMTGLKTGAIVAGYDVANKQTVHYAWNELQDGAKYVLLQHNDVDKSYWQYNAATDSVLVNKIDASKGAGTVNFLIENPLYNAEDYNGKTAVFEFTLSMGSQDRNGDGLYDTNTDNRKGSGSTVWGQINIGYGDGQYDYSRAYKDGGATARVNNGISDIYSLLGNFRITKENPSSTTSSLNMWQLIYYYQTSDSGSGCTKVYNGAEVTVRIAVTIGEDGVPTMLRYYANNVLVTTRYNKVDDKNGFTYHKDVTTNAKGEALTSEYLGGAVESFVKAQYFEISQFMRNDGYCLASFSNFRSWIQ